MKTTDLYTNNKISIKENIENGKTLLFDTKDESIEKASEIGSYHYIAYERVFNKLEEIWEFFTYCYAVPK